MKRILFIALLMLPSLAKAEGKDDFGVWTEVGVEKTLSQHWSAGLETEYRAQEKNRWAIGANASYKMNKYLKFGASYNFIYSHKPEKMSKMVFDEDGELESYRLTPNYWSPRHRISVDAAGDIKLWKWLRISLRERYQLTHRAKQTIERTDVEIGSLYDWETDSYSDSYTPNPKTIDSNNDQVLRSRLKFEIDKKRMPLSPFLSVETHNSVVVGNEMVLEKVRLGLGTGYKINKKNEISLAYLLTFGIHDDDNDLTRIHERNHALNLGYNYKF